MLSKEILLCDAGTKPKSIDSKHVCSHGYESDYLDYPMECLPMLSRVGCTDRRVLAGECWAEFCSFSWSLGSLVGGFFSFQLLTHFTLSCLTLPCLVPSVLSFCSERRAHFKTTPSDLLGLLHFWFLPLLQEPQPEEADEHHQGCFISFTVTL